MAKTRRKIQRRSLSIPRLALVLIVAIAIVAAISSMFFAEEAKQIPQNPNPAQSTPPNQTVEQRDAIQTLMLFHENITQKNYRQAYSCLTPELQSRLKFDGWAEGFKTTISSEVSNIEVLSSSSKQIVLSYDLKAVDEPDKISNFRGTTTLLKTLSGWKINEIINRAR